MLTHRRFIPVLRKRTEIRLTLSDIMTELTFLDLFAGAGGLSTGMELAGWKCPVANEHIATFAETYKLNHPETEMIVGDVRNLTCNHHLQTTPVELRRSPQQAHPSPPARRRTAQEVPEPQGEAGRGKLGAEEINA